MQAQPRLKVESGRLVRRLPLVDPERDTSTLELAMAEATVAFYADDTPPPEKERN